jgi:hypothetical protein
LGFPSQIYHAGHPIELSDYDKIRSSIQPFDINDLNSYLGVAILPKKTRKTNAQEISSDLYYLSPGYERSLLISKEPDACYNEMARCIAFIC